MPLPATQPTGFPAVVPATMKIDEPTPFIDNVLFDPTDNQQLYDPADNELLTD